MLFALYIFVSILKVGRCDPVPTVYHAVANSSSANAGNVVGYMCGYGYKFNGLESPVIYCDGISWTDMPVHCTGRCCSVFNCIFKMNLCFE